MSLTEIQKKQKKKFSIWQNRLRRKLEREAFEDKYECRICGKRKKLHVHHLIYVDDEELFGDPRYWVILCDECHNIQPKDYSNDKWGD